MAPLAVGLQREERSHELGTFLPRLFLFGICSERYFFCGRRIGSTSANEISFPPWGRSCAHRPWCPCRFGWGLGLQYLFVDGLSCLVWWYGLSADALQQCGCVVWVFTGIAYRLLWSIDRLSLPGQGVDAA